MKLITRFSGLNRTSRHAIDRRTPRRRRVTIDELERRVTPATLTTFEFQIPAAVANLGVQLAIFGTTPASTSQQYLAENSGVYSYQNDPTSGLLPMITLSNPSTTNQQNVTVSIPIPAGQFTAGEAVMFVGPNAGLKIQLNGANKTGFASVPSVSTNPNDTFSLFELTNIQQTTGVDAGEYSLDVDISEIDQLGFTYTVTSSNAAPYPLSKVGTTPDRSTFFTRFSNAFTTNNTAFLESLKLGQNSSGDQVRLVAPQTILGTYEQNGPNLLSAAVSGTGGNGGLTQGTAYYYLITATSAVGETQPSANLAYAGAISNNTSSVVLNWQPYTGIQTGSGQNNPFVLGSSVTTGYNIYRGVGQAPDKSGSHPPALNGFQFIGSVSGVNTTTFTDQGFAAQSKTPPANSYGFDPLSTYFTSVINNFFTYYETHTFTYIQDPQNTGYGPTTFSGTTKSIIPDWEAAGSNIPYTVLQLTGSGGEFNGDTFNIYDPMFSSNTNNPSLPPMPTWLSAANSASESASQMVFGCNGVFATNTIDPDVQSLPNTGDAQKSIANIENMIVSAFNRGISTIAPGQWVNPLQFSADPTPGTISGGSLTPGQTYYYLITSVGPGGLETVPTREVAATVGAGQNAITLNWAAVSSSAATSFNIYRGTASGGEVLIATVSNIVTPPPTSYVDLGGQAASTVVPPYQFYAPGSTSNLYSAFLHQNSTTNPTTGISINGLVYGYPFDDQGNFSTNIQYPTGVFPTTVIFSINPFTPAPPTPSPVTITTTAGVPFTLAIPGATGETISFASSDPRALLPAPYTFVSADNGSHVFNLTLFQAGDKTVTITGAGNGLLQTDTVIVLPAAANHIAFSPLPRTEFVNTPFEAIVGVYDAYGNLVTDASGVVALSSPDMKGTRWASIENGSATFVIMPTRPGYTFLQANSSYGSVRSGVISISNAQYFAVKANPVVVEGRPFFLTVLARKPFGFLDRLYQGTIDVFDSGKLVGYGGAVNGIAEIEVSLPPKPGYQFLLIRDGLKMSLMGRKFVRVVVPGGFPRMTRFVRRV